MTDRNEANKDRDDVAFSLDFESRFIEAIEELKLKRVLERENEKNLNSLLGIKYDLEQIIEDERRKHAKEKEELEREMSILKKEIDDRTYQVKDMKDGQEQISKMYKNEINTLRDQLVVVHGEKLTIQKQLKSVDNKLRLHSSVLETVSKRFAEFQQEASKLEYQQKELDKMHKDLNLKVEQTLDLVEKQNMKNKHLMDTIKRMAHRNSSLTTELAKSRSKVIVRVLSGQMGILKMPKSNPTKLSEVTQHSDWEAKYNSLEERHKELLQKLQSIISLLNEHIEAREKSEKEKEEVLQKIEIYEENRLRMETELELANDQIQQLSKRSNNPLNGSVEIAEKTMEAKETIDAEVQVTHSDFHKHVNLIHPRLDSQSVSEIQEDNSDIKAGTSEKDS